MYLNTIFILYLYIKMNKKNIIVIRVFRKDAEALEKMKLSPYEGICFPLQRLIEKNRGVKNESSNVKSSKSK